MPGERGIWPKTLIRAGARPRSAGTGSQFRDPKFIIRVILGILLAANLVAGGIYLFPPGGSPEDLERQLASLRAQIAQSKILLAQTREYASKVEKGRAEGDKFLTDYFLDRRDALRRAGHSSGGGGRRGQDQAARHYFFDRAD